MSTRSGGNRGAATIREGSARRYAGGGGSKAAKAGEAEKAPAEGIHERAARLQREGGLREEAKPGSKNPVLDHVEGAKFNPYSDRPGGGLGAPGLAKMYGEHALGAQLHGYGREKLNAEAGHLGVKPGRSKAETVSRIVSHVTQGRYSANFGGEKAAGGTKAAKAGGTKAAKGEKAAKAGGTKAAKGEKAGAETKGAKASKGEGKTGGKTARANSVRPEGVPEFARIDSQLALHFRDMHNVPPHDLWSRFGGSRQSVYDALKVEPRGALEAIAHNFVGHGAMPRMVRSGRYAEATNRHRLATTIADHLHAQFGGENQ